MNPLATVIPALRDRTRRLAAGLLLLLGCARLPAATDPAAITASELPSPAAAHAFGPSFATGPDGGVWLSWVEPGTAGRPNALRLSRYEPGARAWGVARAVAAVETVAANPADFPQVAIDGRGRFYGLWPDGHGGANLSTSNDGATWSVPQPWVSDGHPVGKFSLTRLADGRVLVAWIDDRARRGAGPRQQLFARIAGEPETTDQQVAPTACDGCAPSLTPFLDGGARLAYRGRAPDDIRDIFTARFRGNTWEQPRLLNNDDWQAHAPPVNGPRLSGDGSRVAVAWFTAAAGEAAVNVSFSPDAGERWLMPLRVDRGHPVGHVDGALLRDSTVLVAWLETDGSLWLRRVSPEFAVNGEFEVALPHGAALSTEPRLELWRDYAGGQSDAEVLLTFTGGGEAGGVRTFLVKVPEGQLLRSERNCDCLPPPNN